MELCGMLRCSSCCAGATVTSSTVTVEGCGSDSLQGDVRFAEVMGLMGAQVEWQPYSITITGPCQQSPPPTPPLVFPVSRHCPMPALLL